MTTAVILEFGGPRGTGWELSHPEGAKDSRRDLRRGSGCGKPRRVVFLSNGSQADSSIKTPVTNEGDVRRLGS
ncbi:hypothetical protein PSCLAVI8L_100176 [Pseudoclavibacter sp. 8L]|nr:hypothetical protein PSCLAVI8L_100176 [Pseudoclavibacter sp. 8L]